MGRIHVFPRTCRYPGALSTPDGPGGFSTAPRREALQPIPRDCLPFFCFSLNPMPFRHGRKQPQDRPVRTHTIQRHMWNQLVSRQTSLRALRFQDCKFPGGRIFMLCRSLRSHAGNPKISPNQSPTLDPNYSRPPAAQIKFQMCEDPVFSFINFNFVLASDNWEILCHQFQFLRLIEEEVLKLICVTQTGQYYLHSLEAFALCLRLHLLLL